MNALLELAAKARRAQAAPRTTPPPQEQPSPVPNQAAAQVAAPPARSAAPKYLEFFGDAFDQVGILRNVVVCLLVLAVVQETAIYHLSNKPPFVIRVDALHGATAIKDVDANDAVTQAELRNFAEHFTRDLMGWDVYSLDDDMSRAFTMIAPDAKPRIKSKLDELRVFQQVKTDQLRTKVLIQEISVEKDTLHTVTLKVLGTRVAESYEKKALRRETGFEDTLVVRRVGRTEASPWGLFVEQWDEHIYKETTTP